MAFAEFVGNSSGTSLGSPVAMTNPTGVQAGDLLVMVGTHKAVNGSILAAPPGWAIVASFGVGGDWVAVFSRTATGGDAGASFVLETGDADSPLFGGAAACIAAYRGGAGLGALSVTLQGSGTSTSSIATAASVDTSRSAAVLGLFGAYSVSGADITTNDPTRAHADSGKAAAAISERLAPTYGPTGAAQANVGGAEWVAWQLELLIDVQAIMPPARLYPREDGLATSSATRIFPQPRSQQGGLRLSGGTYY